MNLSLIRLQEYQECFSYNEISLIYKRRILVKFLSTFKITKGFDAWLAMYKDIEPDLNELGIKIL